MLDLSKNDNFVLSLENGGFDQGECINCVAYNKSSGRLSYQQLLITSVVEVSIFKF